ncbi:hypothetical protein [Methanosarcina horonobensis]|uniref:hypothetical protein n=1 Tax=Methanosarcina horonobensis TaxID=418008 RepID=UPI000A92BBDF|nr:hypothetical protein [Methanosarcina horonobensis]
MNQAYLNLVSKLVSDEGITKRKVAELSDIPVSTLNVWLSKAEEAPSLIGRVFDEETTTTNVFLK